MAADFSLPSARVLRQAIENITGTHHLITTKDRFAPSAIARFGGNAMPINGDTNLNSIERINALANKNTFARMLTDAQIAAPVFTGHGARTFPTTYPVLVRSTLTSYGGRGITVCTNAEEFNAAMRPGCYWTPFINMATEYRVHVAGGQVLRVFEKVREDGAEPERYPIRNNDRGWHFSIRNNPRHGVSIRNTVERICALPLFSSGFFALDLGWVADTRSIFVIEGNSTPGLNDETARCYAEYIVNNFNGGAQNAEVLRPATHPAGATNTNPPAPKRDEHKPAPVRTKWSW